MLCRFIRYSCIYEARMSPALKGNSAIRCFKGSDASKVRNEITFAFYTGLPNMYIVPYTIAYKPTHQHKKTTQVLVHIQLVASFQGLPCSSVLFRFLLLLEYGRARPVVWFLLSETPSISFIQHSTFQHLALEMVQTVKCLQAVPSSRHLLSNMQ